MDKTFLSIGAGPGIGLATAMRFAREGHSIVLCARNPDRLRPCAARIASVGARVDIRQVDAADPRGVAALVASVGEDLRVVHFNTASLHYDANKHLESRTIDAESVDSIMADINVNAVSALAAIKAALVPFRALRSGTVLVTGGGFAMQPSGSYFTLSVGKAALRAAVQALFEPMREEGIHLASVVVCRYVTPESAEAAAIADEFWRLYAQPREAWTMETVY